MTSTEGVRAYDDLPENARKYVELIEDKLGLPGMPGLFSFDMPCKDVPLICWLFCFSAVDRRRQGPRLNDSAILRRNLICDGCCALRLVASALESAEMVVVSLLSFFNYLTCSHTQAHSSSFFKKKSNFFFFPLFQTLPTI